MKAIILAAGRGSRLEHHTDDKPKCLLNLGGKTLIQRSIENLLSCGMEKVVLVLGYRHEMIEKILEDNFPKDRYQVILNPDYTRGSGSSLMCARKEICGDVLLVESDLLYHREIPQRMCRIANNNMAMGHFLHGRREVKIYLENDHIERAAWGEPHDKEAAGDWVGFTRLVPHSAALLRHSLMNIDPERGKEIHYEYFIFQLLNSFVFQATYIQDLPWIEIDNSIDLKRAQRQVCPKIDGIAVALAAG